ncbi:MAG: tol-pal system protein YbgF [Sulfuricella sp.]|nr:tol-pal system protein YbgF [Sulfuricella sp.]
MRRLALLPVLLLAGVCHAGLFTDDEAQARITDLQKQNAVLQDKLQGLDARLASQEQTQRGSGLDTLSQIEAVRADLAKLRGQLEEQAHEIETTQKRQHDLYVDLDSRLRLLEQRVAAPLPSAAVEEAKPGKGKKQAGKTAPSAPVVPAVEDPVAEGKAYDAAFNLFKMGNYQGALAAFQQFIQTYPQSPLAPSSQYWIGNSYFNLRDFTSAISSQQTLISQYPKSPKVPDAMLNIATCQQNMGDNEAAKKSLEDLVARFPLSDAGEKARKRLAAMK